jgi:hypothetical protein
MWEDPPCLPPERRVFSFLSAEILGCAAIPTDYAD